MKFDHVALAKKRLADLELQREAFAGLINAYTDKQTEIDGDIQAIELFLSTAAELEGLPWSDEVEQSA